MVNGLWGRKLGMAQIFTDDKKVVSVTVIDVNHWIVTQVKDDARDGYHAIQVGLLRSRYQEQKFDVRWLKSLKTYFSVIREVRLAKAPEGIEVGGLAPLEIFAVGDVVDVVGVSKGAGFAGAMRRHGFSGGPASHGSMFHRRTGSGSFMRSRGRIIKGKRFPGHMGVRQKTIKRLSVVSLDAAQRLVLVKGSVPGKPGAAVFVCKTR